MATWCISLHFTEQIVVPLESSHLKTCTKTLYSCFYLIFLQRYDEQEICSVEHGICPIAEFTNPWLNCAHSNRIPAEIWRFLILIFQDGGGRHPRFGLFTQNAQGWQDVTRQNLIIYVLNINNHDDWRDANVIVQFLKVVVE